MAMYLGKLVELRTRDGTYRGTVCDAAQGKVLLEEVQFIDENGATSSLPRIRITKSDVVDRSIRILDDRGGGTVGNDPISMYNQAEQRLAAPSERTSRRTAGPQSRMVRSKSQPREPAHEDWSMDSNNVFPPDNVFEMERVQHQTQLVQVNGLREMADYCNYCILNDPNDRNFTESLQFITSGSIARVGLGIFGSPLSRTTRPSWIAVSTPRGVFVFDVRFMNVSAFASCGLADFLARPPNILPRKIMHDSRCAADSLKYCFNVDLNIFCDTLAMKTCIFMRDSFGKVPRNTWNLFDLLYEYAPLEKDLDILDHRYDFAQFESDVWNARPAKESVLHLAVALTVHMCDLYDCLNKELMRPIVYASNIMLNAFRNSNNAPFTTREALMRMPDGVGELAGSTAGSQYVLNAVGAKTRKLTADVAYKKGLIRCGMGAFIATTSNGYFSEA